MAPHPHHPATTGHRAPTPRWRISSFSTGSDATCVDVAIPDAAADPSHARPVVLVRNSTDQDGPVLRFTFAEWRVFLLGVRAGEFELPGHDSAAPDGPAHDGPAHDSAVHDSPASREASSARERSGSVATRQASSSAAV